MHLQSVLIPVGIVLVVVMRLITVLLPLAAKGERFPKKLRLWALGEPRDGRLPKSENLVM